MNRRSTVRLAIGIAIFVALLLVVRFFASSLLDGLESMHGGGGH